MSKVKGAKRGQTSDEVLDSIIQSNVTADSEKALYLANGILAAFAPLYLYTAIFGLSVRDYVNAFAFIIVTGVIAFQISKAYENVFRSVYNSIAQKRGLYRGREETEKQRAISNAQTEISKYEAICVSIVYNNILFFVLVIFLGSFLFANLSSFFNYIVTGCISASLVSIFSASSKQ
jgi:hypothetical protein